jgi:hypothetical protein
VGIAFHWQFISQVAEVPRQSGRQQTAGLARPFASAYDPAKT